MESMVAAGWTNMLEIWKQVKELMENKKRLSGKRLASELCALVSSYMLKPFSLFEGKPE